MEQSSRRQQSVPHPGGGTWSRAEHDAEPVEAGAIGRGQFDGDELVGSEDIVGLGHGIQVTRSSKTSTV